MIRELKKVKEESSPQDKYHGASLSTRPLYRPAHYMYLFIPRFTSRAYQETEAIVEIVDSLSSGRCLVVLAASGLDTRPGGSYTLPSRRDMFR
jgi:hypothetical protein